MKGKGKKEEVDFSTLPKANIFVSTLMLDFKNPDTKYKLSWFKNEESPIEENENTDTYSYTVDDWESGDETEYAGFLKKAGATSIKYEHEDEGSDFHILFTPYPGVTIEQLAKKFAMVQKRAYPHNDYDEVWFYNRTKDKPVKIVI